MKTTNGKLDQTARIIINKCLCNPEVSDMVNKLYHYDPLTFEHSSNVAFLSVKMALRECFDDSMVSNIAVGGLLHDIGKISIPIDILNKNGPLTDVEYSIVKEHTTQGYVMVKGLHISKEAKEIVLKHHERLDGTGYPMGLKDKDIPWYVKYVSICDVYDAMTSPRPYKFPFLSEYAIHEIGRYVDTEFDRISFEQLCKCIGNY